MNLNSPLPQPLPKECKKAAQTFRSFVEKGNNGLDGVIPRHVLQNAKGFAIFTVVKAGFVFSARAGAGVVIARLDDGTWSAPSAIGTAGLGVGGQAGAEITDFLIVLNSRSAIRSFMAAGSLTLGGNMSIAVGPLGRNGEASGSISTSGKVAAMYSYSKTRGLFGGLSIEGSVIVERQDANTQAYKCDISAKQILSGAVNPPDWALPLIQILETCAGTPRSREWVNDSGHFSTVGGGQGLGTSDYAFGSDFASTGTGGLKNNKKNKPSGDSQFPPSHWGMRKNGGSYFSSPGHDEFYKSSPFDGVQVSKEEIGSQGAHEPTRTLMNDGSTASFPMKFDSDFTTANLPSVGTPQLRPTHRTTQSVLSKPTHKSSFNPGSPFNDLFPFLNGNPTHTTDSWHGRSASVPATISRASQSALDSNNESALSTNPYCDQPSDPFAYDLDGDMLLNSDASKAEERPRPHSSAVLSDRLNPLDGIGRAIALFDFTAIESGDLSFRKGQVITIIKKSNKTDDWWTGKLDGKEGIFPANFVEVV